MYVFAAGRPDGFPMEGAENVVRGYTHFFDLLPYLVVAMLAMVAGVAVVWLVRRRVRSDVSAGPIARGASLSTYRTMRDRGELSEEEYQAIRKNLVHRMRDEGDV